MTNLGLHLSPILDAVKIQSETAFSFQNENYTFSSETESEAKLRDLLYERGYMRPIDAARSPNASNSNGSLLTGLRAANAALPRWQSDWRIYEVHKGAWISAQRDGIGRTFAPGEFVTKEGPGMPLRVGAMVDVYFATESLHMQPGFYFAFSETVADESDYSALLRFYWHLEPAGAPLLLHSISTLLNRFQVPYRFKCLSHPAAYIRADSAVLFVPRRWYQIVARLLSTPRRAISPHLRTGAPLFAKPLADGLAFAEDPGAGQSFGMHRCTALAQTIRDVALRQQALSLTAVEQGLSSRGISPAFPYLNPGSADIYDFLP